MFSFRYDHDFMLHLAATGLKRHIGICHISCDAGRNYLHFCFLQVTFQKETALGIMTPQSNRMTMSSSKCEKGTGIELDLRSVDWISEWILSSHAASEIVFRCQISVHVAYRGDYLCICSLPGLFTRQSYTLWDTVPTMLQVVGSQPSMTIKVSKPWCQDKQFRFFLPAIRQLFVPHRKARVSRFFQKRSNFC